MEVLIDGDIVCFRCAASCENDDVDLVFYRINEMMDGILNATQADSFRVFLSGKENFRKEVYPEYKAHRSKIPRPRWLEDAREFMETEFKAQVSINEEADDLLGINQTEDTIICSIDKDLLQVPGKHFNFVKQEFYTITDISGLKHFYKQCLMGDRADNIVGIPGIGDKKADKILLGLETEQEFFNAVREAYSNDEEFIMNARCLWIRRKENEDFRDHFKRLANENEFSESKGQETPADSSGQGSGTLP
ncbi:exodeoxyribonuclease [Caudoviricetes sp.]|nr:exodeoxyribonuclease [Caudoviricetes sp.]